MREITFSQATLEAMAEVGTNDSVFVMGRILQGKENFWTV